MYILRIIHAIRLESSAQKYAALRLSLHERKCSNLTRFSVHQLLVSSFPAVRLISTCYSVFVFFQNLILAYISLIRLAKTDEKNAVVKRFLFCAVPDCFAIFSRAEIWKYPSDSYKSSRFMDNRKIKYWRN